MAINLEKGGRVNLEKEAPGLANIQIGLGWKPRASDGAKFDLDASAIMVNADGKAASDKSIIFYNNLKSQCESVIHMGDNLTGEGEGDDEVVKVDLSKLPEDIEKLILAVNIFDAANRNQNFGQVDDAFIRLVNSENQEEILRYDLTEDYSTETAMSFGELYKKDGQWRFVAKGEGFAGGLPKLLETVGL